MASKKVKELCKIEEKRVPIFLECINIPIFNPKLTHTSTTAYIGLGELQGKNGAKYLVAIKDYNIKYDYSSESASGSLMPGTIVHFEHKSGSHRHTKYSYSLFFRVEEGIEDEIIVDEKENFKIKVKNLRLIEKLPKEKLVELETEILNRGWKPSQYDPIRTLYHYFKPMLEKKEIKITFVIRSIEDIDEAIKKLEELKKQFS